MSYLSLADLERELSFGSDAVQLDDEEWTELLTNLLEQESDRIDSMTGTQFDLVSVTETLYGEEATAGDGDDLILPDRPIVSVESIDADGEALDVATDVRVRETHVALLDEAPIDRWPDGPIEVSWTYGYDEVPGPVRDGVIRLVRSRLIRIQSDGLESESLPSGQNASFRPPEEVIAAVASTVAQYRPDGYHGGAMVI